MTTFANMKTRIADDLNRSDLTTQIGREINRAIKHYESEPFWFKQTSSTCATVANQQTLSTSDVSPLPSTIKEIDYVEITSGSNVYKLDRKSIQEILDLTFSSTDKGEPTSYSLYQNKFYFHPIPDAIYTITIYFTKSYTALSADSDENDWTTEAEDLIEARAEKVIYRKILKDKIAADDMEILESQALENLRAKSSSLQSTGSLQPTQF